MNKSSTCYCRQAPIQALGVIERWLHGLNIHADNDHDPAAYKSKRSWISGRWIYSDSLLAKPMQRMCSRSKRAEDGAV